MSTSISGVRWGRRETVLSMEGNGVGVESGGWGSYLFQGLKYRSPASALSIWSAHPCGWGGGRGDSGSGEGVDGCSAGLCFCISLLKILDVPVSLLNFVLFSSMQFANLSSFS